MAVYVLSDVHGHLRALDGALAQASPAADDRVYVLGDMVDRGPDPMGVIRLLRALPNVTVLAGNHVQLMLSCVGTPDDRAAWDLWMRNGGTTTAQGLMGLVPEAYEHTVSWVRRLPLFDVVTAGGRPWVLVHAGIVDPAPPEGGVWDERSLFSMLLDQRPDDLLWVRSGFWNRPTGLVSEDGPSPVVVAGHTPTTYLPYVTDAMDGPVADGDGRGVMVWVGGDKLDVDCAAAGGHPEGQVGIVRLDDGATFYEPVGEGE